MKPLPLLLVWVVALALLAWYVGFWLWVCNGIGGPWWAWFSPVFLAVGLWLWASVCERLESRRAERMDAGLLRFVQREVNKGGEESKPVVLPRPPQPNRIHR